MDAERQQLEQILQPVGQSHLLTFWPQLTEGQRRALADEIRQVDWSRFVKLLDQQHGGPDWAELARRAQRPSAIRLGQTPDGWSLDDARQAGEQALTGHRVALVIVAGGQGTRLGFDPPKGMYPIGPLSDRTLFQMHFDRIRAVSRRYRTRLPVLIMTSQATDAETIEYLARQHWFGLAADDVHVFRQGSLPAVDDAGRVLLATPSSLALSPDGHGGMLEALDRSGLLERLSQQGIEQLFYFQVDNPLVEIGDPMFVGHHLLARSEITTQVVAKTDPLERVGNVVSVDNRAMVIEYSDLPDDVAERRDADGQLLLWAGNIAVHMFDVEFLRRQLQTGCELPIHFARKKVPCVDVKTGNAVDPEEPNATKFERFIFDLLPRAERTLVVEVDERQAFAPLKNAPGAPKDTPEYVQRMLVERDLRMARQAGIDVAPDVRIEINPLFALDAAELKSRLGSQDHIAQDQYFAPLDDAAVSSDAAARDPLRS